MVAPPEDARPSTQQQQHQLAKSAAATSKSYNCSSSFVKASSVSVAMPAAPPEPLLAATSAAESPSPELLTLTEKLAALRPTVTPLKHADKDAMSHKMLTQQVPNEHQRQQPRDVKVQFGRIDENNVEKLRKLNLTIFPVRYNDAFYSDILRTPREYSKFAYVDNCVVGAICCRLEPVEHHLTLQRTYIMTLGVLESYRQCHIGSVLLQSIITQSLHDGVVHIYLHVQTSNSVAIQFYRKFGFEIAETIRDYYKRIEPPDCFILLKKLQ